MGFKSKIKYSEIEYPKIEYSVLNNVRWDLILYIRICLVFGRHFKHFIL